MTLHAFEAYTNNTLLVIVTIENPLLALLFTWWKSGALISSALLLACLRKKNIMPSLPIPLRLLGFSPYFVNLSSYSSKNPLFLVIILVQPSTVWIQYFILAWNTLILIFSLFVIMSIRAFFKYLIFPRLHLQLLRYKIDVSDSSTVLQGLKKDFLRSQHNLSINKSQLFQSYLIPDGLPFLFLVDCNWFLVFAYGISLF